jgi:rRNA maturation endonuclease Nob1
MKRLVVLSLIIMLLVLSCQIKINRDIEWKVTCGNCGFYFGLDCHCGIEDIKFCPHCGKVLGYYKIEKVK